MGGESACLRLGPEAHPTNLPVRLWSGEVKVAKVRGARAAQPPSYQKQDAEQHPAGPQSPDSTCLSRLRLPVLTPCASHNGRLSGAGRPPSLFSTCSLRAGKC